MYEKKLEATARLLEVMDTLREKCPWDKEQTFLNFSQWEMAWTSFDTTAKIFRFSNRGFTSPEKQEKIHPHPETSSFVCVADHPLLQG